MKRSNDYLEKSKKETDYVPVESIESSIEHLFSNVMGKSVKVYVIQLDRMQQLFNYYLTPKKKHISGLLQSIR